MGHSFKIIMKITDYLAEKKDETVISFEILPPLKGGSIQSIFDSLDPLMEFKPPFVDVTYHREEYDYKQRPGGYYEKTSIRKRPGTVGICAAIMNRYGVEAVPHLICGGFTVEETENALIDLSFLGINNVLALRGDARKLEGRFIPEPGGHNFAIDMVRQIEKMNKGKYLESEGQATDICIGVAGYPEKHFEAPNMKLDMQFLKEKVDAGADYIVTQMFFDNQKYFDFVDLCREYDINVPIIPGLKPLTRKSQILRLPSIFYVNFPEELVEAVIKAKDKEAVKQVGIEWCIQQSKELKARGVPCLHYYTMGDVNTFVKIGKEVF